MAQTNDYQESKNKIDIKSEIERRSGQTAKQEGKGFALPECPFCGGHECFKITPAENVFNCFQCDAGGSVIDFVMKQDQCTELEALKALAEAHGIELSTKFTGQEGDQAVDPDTRRIFEAAAEHYHNLLINNKRALSYQTGKRKHSIQTLKHFRVGYTDGNLHRHLEEMGFTREQMLESGLVKKRKGTIQDFFIGGLYVYPHIGPSGSVGHFSAKDPRKKYNYRLSNEHRDPGCVFFNMPALKSNTVMLVEGENDALSVCGRGAFESAIACCGQITGDQVEHLRIWAGKGAEKTIYLCFDHDDAGERYGAKAEKALIGYCQTERLASTIQNLPERDRGAIEGNGDDRENEPQHSIAEIRNLNLRIIHFNGRFKDIDEYLKGEKQPAAAMRSLIESSEAVLMPLKSMLALYRYWCNKLNVKPTSNEIGEIAFAYFRKKGRFFVDNGKCFLYYEKTKYEIGNNTPFKSLLYHLAGINAANTSSRQVIEVLLARSYELGRHTRVPGWIHTDHDKLAIHFNLNNDSNEILKITPGNLEIIQNGTNSDQILLLDSPKMRPLNFIPDVDVQHAIGLLFKQNVMDNLACNASDKFFIAAIILNVITIQYCKARGVTKFSGTRASGKTGAAALITALVYGQDYVTIGSPAADFSEATRSPVTIQDNLEADTMNRSQRDFLLVAATGITKQKRKGGTDSENVYEKVCTQVIVTAIEPFFEGELISRTNDIIFGEQYFNPDFVEATELESKISTARDMIWSAFFKVIANDVLPGFKEKRKAALKMLKEEYGGHAKSRLNELYSCLFVLLGELLKYMPHPEHSSRQLKTSIVQHLVLQDWIEQQDRLDKATASDTNPILYRLTLLVKEYLRNSEWFSQVYSFECSQLKNCDDEPIEVQFIASTSDLYSAFEILARNRGGRCPYNSVRQLGARLKDSMKVLEGDGWRFHAKIKTVRGEPKHAFTKTFSN